MPIALAGLPLIVAALFSLLFMLAWHQWGNAITNTLAVNIPVIGNVIATAVDEALEAGYAGVVYWLDQALYPLAELLLRPIAAVENTFDAVYVAMGSYYTAINSVVFNRIVGGDHALDLATEILTAAITADAHSYTDMEIAGVNSHVFDAFSNAQSLLSDSEAYTRQLFGQLSGELGNAVLNTAAITAIATEAATGVIGNVLNEAEAFANMADSQLLTYILGTLETAGVDVAGILSTAEGYTDAAVAGVAGVIATDLAQGITGALAGIYTDIDIAIDQVIDVAAGDDVTVIDAIRAIPRAVPTDLAGVAALTGAGTLSLLRFLKECGIPNCRNLSGFGNSLGGLTALAGDAGFLAMIVEMVAHPSEAAEIVNDVFGAVITPALDTAKSLIGV